MSTTKLALAAIEKLQNKLEAAEMRVHEPIAIIGMSARIPGADNSEALWKILKDRIDITVELPKNRWDIDQYYSPDKDAPGKLYTKCGVFFDAVDYFDADFFNISPREASSIDPQQRIMLETAFEAIENAGQAPEKLIDTKTGVFIGIMTDDYSKRISQENAFGAIDAYYASGNEFSFTSGRISYILGLNGPSMAVDTACSSSMVAIHLACQSLRLRESDMCIAGGVNLILSPELGISLCKFKALSTDGRCKSFDADADGFGRGEGCGALVLKRLSDAIDDRDNILAVIRGSAVNHDGPSGGLTVPSGSAQQAMIRNALNNANIEANQIDYFEAHGTGTALGDPIEVHAIQAVLGKGRGQDRPLVIGSVKTNIGHLDSASGVAGLIKVVLSLQHEEIPAHLNFKKLNPNITLTDQFEIKIPTRKMPWPKGEKKRYAGVSSFGFSGTNAHVIVEEAPAVKKEIADVERPEHILCLSAKSADALDALAVKYVQHLSAGTSDAIGDICFTANTGRSHYNHRLSVRGNSIEQMRERLTRHTKGQAVTGVTASQKKNSDEPGIVFVFTGQGAQYAGMGRVLYETQSVFRRILDRCDELLRDRLEHPLLSVIYPEQGRAELLNETAYTQPALFALEYALAELWRSWGIAAEAVVGHSVGEYVAACVAGVFSLEDGLRLIAERGRLIQGLKHNGAMAAVFADQGTVLEAIEPYAGSVSLACANAPEETVISGLGKDVEAVVAALQSGGIGSQVLNVSHAFHSVLMEPILDAFERKASEVRYQLPKIGLISNVTGELVTDDSVSQAGYWRRHIRQPVRFLNGMQTIERQGYDLLIEVGPHPILTVLGMRCMPGDSQWLPSLRKGRDDWQQITESLARLYGKGVSVDWQGFDQDYPRRKVALPTYPFQRQRYWIKSNKTRKIEGARPKSIEDPRSIVHPLLGWQNVSPLKEIQFKSCLNGDSLALLKDHRVKGRLVFPGTAYAEMGMAAAKEAFKIKLCPLENLLMSKPLILPEKADQGCSVQLILYSGPGKSAAFKIFSHREKNSWTLHAQGEVRLEFEKEAPEIKDGLSEIKKKCNQEIDIEEYYKKLHKAGLEYGPSFSGISSLWHGKEEALGFVQLTDENLEETIDFQLNPALLDGCFQVALATLPETMASISEAFAFVPVGFKSLRPFDILPEKVWTHAVFKKNKEDIRESLHIDLSIFSEEGQIVARVEDLHLKRVSLKALSKSSKPEYQEWLYNVRWQRKDLSKVRGSEASGQANKTWLLFCDSSDVAEGLEQRIQAHGGRCIKVSKGDGFLAAEAGGYRVKPTDAQDFKLLLREVSKTQGSVSGIVYLWALDSRAGAETDQAEVCGGLLHLIQAMVGTSGAGSARLYVLTRGVQPVGTDAGPLSVGQAPVWGLGGTIGAELPEFGCIRIDLDPWPEADESGAIFNEIIANSGEDQVALRHNGRFVARLVRAGLEEADLKRRLQLPQGEAFELDIEAKGSLENLKFQSVGRGEPGPGEVEIRVLATGLNFKDILKALGQYAGPDKCLGDECAGKITAVGPGVKGLHAGDDVLALAQGSFSAYATVSSDLVARKPDNLSFDEAASFPVVFLTAYHTLHRLARISEGKRILIHAAAGGVGLAAVQLAQQAGAEIFATAGSPRKRAFLRSLGVRHVMNSRTLDFVDQVRQLTGGVGVDIVLNSLAGDFIGESLSVVAPNGCFLEIGRTDIWDEQKVAQLRPDIAYFPVFLVDTVNEQPAMLGAMLRELMAQVAQGRIKALPQRTYALTEAVDAFRHMAQARHIGKIVLSQQEDLSRSWPGRIQSDGTYLITGGLGGLGLKVSQWLVAQGARHLVLIGRSAAKARAQDAILALESAGAQVVVARADVSKKEQIGAVLDQISESMPPLKGIVHTAGVLDDGILQQQNWERFERVFAPKVQGAWHLHQLTMDAHLDFFVLFSSISSLFNPAGQGNYSAANSFLDILAHHRSIQGLPALSINWGAWSNVGMMATRDRRDQERWTRMGVGRMTPEQGVEIFAKILSHKSAQIGITPLDWKVFKKNWSPGKNLPYLRRLDQAEVEKQILDQNSHPEIDILQTLKTATQGKRHLILRSHIVDKIRAVLGHDSSVQIEYDRALEELGFDSLMSVQLRNTLVDSLKVNLPTTLVYDYPTVEALTDFILQGAFSAIFAGETEKAENADDTYAKQTESKDEKDIEILSEEDANAFLLVDLEKLEKKYLFKEDD